MKKTDITEIYDAFGQSERVSIDSRTLIKGDIFFALSGPNFNGNQYAKKALAKGAAFAVVDDMAVIDKEDNRYLFVEDVLLTLQKLATLHRNSSKTKVLAITGSNGKTTTKELIATVLAKKFNIIFTQGNLNNHIGVPLTLLQIKPDTEIAIIEMGANHIGEIEALCEIAQPDMGLITNIGEAHLEGFGSIEGIQQGKGELYEYLKEKKGLIFLNQDEPILTDMLHGYDGISRYGSSIPFYDSTLVSVESKKGNLFLQAESKDEAVELEMALYGAYNSPNILTAIAVGQHFEIDLRECLEAVAAYSPTNKRSEVITTASNFIVLDAYNANPSSMRVAIKEFVQKEERNRLMILGDMFELGRNAKALHQEIADMADSSDIDTIYIGHQFSNTTAKGKQFEELNQAIEYFKEAGLREATILIKGSRSMKLESLVEFL